MYRYLIFLFLALLFLPAGIVLAQGGVEHTNFAWALGLGNSVQVLPGASITVCAGTVVPLLGTTCSPTTQIYTDPFLITLAQNPLSSDNGGNFNFWAFPGNSYVISVSKSGYVTYSYSWTAASTLVSPSPNPAQSGFLRLANGDCITWRNALNNGDLCLDVGSTNQIFFNGSPLASLGSVQSWTATQNLQAITTTSVSDSGLTPGNCVQSGSGGLLTAASGPCLVGTAVTVTGSPANGNLAIFSGPTSLTNGNLSGDISTANGTVATLAGTIGGAHNFTGTITTTNQALNGTPTGSALQGTDPKLMTAGTVSGTSVLLCTDISGGATTSGCPSTPLIIFEGQLSMPAANVTTGNCSSTTTLSAPGTVSTDVINVGESADISSNPATFMFLRRWVSPSGTLNFRYCNPDSAQQNATTFTYNVQVVR